MHSVLEDGNIKNPRINSFDTHVHCSQCPGRFFALDNAWLAIACLLATFNITKALDQDGKEIETNIEYTKDFVRYAYYPTIVRFQCLLFITISSHPKPFKCQFVPRFNAPQLAFQTSEIEE